VGEGGTAQVRRVDHRRVVRGCQAAHSSRQRVWIRVLRRPPVSHPSMSPRAGRAARTLRKTSR
jgi:hypothetical protein